MGSTHTLLTPDIIAKRALQLLKNNMVMGRLVHRRYKKEFKKVGESISIKKPVKFSVTTGRTRKTSTITEKSITLTVSTQAHVSWGFNTKDLTMSIKNYSETYIEPAIAALANKVDLELCSLYDDIANEVHESTGFVTPDQFITLGRAGQKLDEEAAPQEGRAIVFNPAAHWSIANALRTVYVQDVAKPIINKGYLARIANFEVYMDQNIRSHTWGHWGTGSGTDGTGLEIATGAPTGTTGFHQYGTTGIALCDFDVVDTKVLVTGDIFTIAGVYAVNPMSGESTGSLRQFVVTADASCGSTGTTTEVPITVYVQPTLIDTGPYKTIDTMPPGGAAIDVIGQIDRQMPQNLAFHRNAFALVVVPLEMPRGVWGARASDKQTGLSVRVVADYDIDVDDEVIRLDILFGVKTLYRELAVRVQGYAQ